MSALHVLRLLRIRLCWQVPTPPHSLHWLLRRKCWQTPSPPQSLQLLLLRACWQMLAPPQSLHLLITCSFSDCAHIATASPLALAPLPNCSPPRLRLSPPAYCCPLLSDPPLPSYRLSHQPPPPPPPSCRSPDARAPPRLHGLPVSMVSPSHVAHSPAYLVPATKA